jgi:hypothetical protein
MSETSSYRAASHRQACEANETRSRAAAHRTRRSHLQMRFHPSAASQRKSAARRNSR